MHRRVLDVMSKPAMAHRSKQFEDVNRELRELLHYLFQSKNEVAIITGSGTAGVEAAISSLLKKGDKVLNITNGKFGERLYEMCKVFAEPTELKFEWGKAPDLNKIAELMEKEQFKAVTLCHNETSTGMTNPAKEIAAIVKKHDSLFILDGITSVGGIEVKPDDWDVDITTFGSQKCIAAPAGLSAVCISKRAEQMLYDDSNYYLSLKKHIEKLKKNDTPWTPAIPLFLALRESLRMLKEEGLENRIKRIEKLAIATRSAVKAMGLKLFIDERYASNTLTAINYPPGINDANFRATLRDKYNIIVAGAQDHIKGKVFRIGHMGICSFNDLLATFGSIEATLKSMDYKFELGSGVKAIVECMS